jgi:hypothetical protein
MECTVNGVEQALSGERAPKVEERVGSHWGVHGQPLGSREPQRYVGGECVTRGSEISRRVNANAAELGDWHRRLHGACEAHRPRARAGDLPRRLGIIVNRPARCVLSPWRRGSFAQHLRHCLRRSRRFRRHPLLRKSPRELAWRREAATTIHSAANHPRTSRRDSMSQLRSCHAGSPRAAWAGIGETVLGVQPLPSMPGNKAA